MLSRGCIIENFSRTLQRKTSSYVSQYVAEGSLDQELRRRTYLGIVHPWDAKDWAPLLSLPLGPCQACPACCGYVPTVDVAEPQLEMLLVIRAYKCLDGLEQPRLSILSLINWHKDTNCLPASGTACSYVNKDSMKIPSMSVWPPMVSSTEVNTLLAFSFECEKK